MSELADELREHAGYDLSRYRSACLYKAADEIELAESRLESQAVLLSELAVHTKNAKRERDTALALLREACKGTCTVTADWYERAREACGE